MSISARLTVALSLAALVLFGGVGFWQLRAETTDLRSDTERDLRLLGRSLQVAFENALRDRQAEDVQETLGALERIDPEVDVFVYDATGAPLAASTGAIERARWLTVRPQTAELHFLPDRDPQSVELLLPLQITREGQAATLVVVHPLDEMRADLQATRWRVILSTFGFVALVAILTMALARFWVGTPLARMNAQMRRVRAGDLSLSPVRRRNDEVGATLNEFDALVRDLADARTRLETEAEARRQLEDGLRHADKLTTIGQLAAGLAHEIGSPLQILEGRLAALEARADDPEETRRVSRILLEQARRITRIVARLSGLVRRTGHTRALEVGPPVRSVVELMEGEARRRQVALNLIEGHDVPLIEGDSDALQQLALNLIRNALDACASGSSIEVEIERAQTRSSDGKPHEGVRVVVRDDGQGMDESTRTRVFDPFFTTRGAESGSGLGLTVVKGIVNDHGGRIELISELGSGSTFIIELPAQPESSVFEQGSLANA